MSDSIYDTLRRQEGRPDEAALPKKLSLITRRGREGKRPGPGDMLPSEGASSTAAPRVVQIKAHVEGNTTTKEK
jgi:hypothetical protein